MAAAREWPPEIDALLLVAGYKARLRDLAEVTGATPCQVLRRLKRLAIATRQRGSAFLPPAALRRAWKQIREGRTPSRELDLWEQSAGPQQPGLAAGSEWARGDDEALRELTGRMSRADIGELLGKRSAHAVAQRQRKLGLTGPPQVYSAGVLARLLGVSGEAIRDAVYAGHVRAWREGSWWYVHAEDAEWLLGQEGGPEWTWDAEHRDEVAVDSAGRPTGQVIRRGYRWGETDWAQLRRDCPLPEKKEYAARQGKVQGSGFKGEEQGALAA